jgi:hypothetical protein
MNLFDAVKSGTATRRQTQPQEQLRIKLYIQQRLDSYCVLSCSSQDQTGEDTVYEPFTEKAVIHGENCAEVIKCEVCTCKAEVSRLEEKRRQWWKNRKHRSLEPATATDMSWDPKYSEDWD